MTNDHQAHCQPHLTQLGLIARGESEIENAYGDVVLATSAIVAEATEATRDAGMFLLVRVDRLVRAADDAIAAAREGNPGELRQRLRRFSTLASAIWTVHDEYLGLRPNGQEMTALSNCDALTRAG